MPESGLEAFDTTLQKTNLWIKEVGDELGWSDKHKSYLALRTVLQALRDRLTIEEATDLGAQLPMLVRGFYYEGWNPSSKPVKYGREEFISRIRERFAGVPDIDAEAVVRAVFSLISRKIAVGEMEDVKDSLPADIVNLVS